MLTDTTLIGRDNQHADRVGSAADAIQLVNGATIINPTGWVAMRKLALLLVAIPLAAPLHAQSLADSPWERFTLFTGCGPVGLRIDVQRDDADIGLTEERVRTMAESRLRAARMYMPYAGPGTEPLLTVAAHASGPAYTYALYFSKKLLDPRTGVSTLMTTWRDSGYRNIGIHGGEAGFIILGISESLDAFILDYLRVNEASCKG